MENENGTPKETGFSAEYVSTLRTENAGWRAKVRELEGQVRDQGIGAELAKRGIAAEANWVPSAEGQSPADAVEAFAQKYPHLVPQADGEADATPPAGGAETRKVGGETPQMKPSVPRDQGPQKTNAGNESNVSFGKMSMDEIKASPAARSKLSKHYQDLIRNDGHQNG